MSFGSRDLLARSPQNVPYLNVADESASVSIRSGKGLPLRDVTNSWPFGPAMLETRPYLLGLFFFGWSLVLQSCRRIRLQKPDQPPTNK